MTTDSIFINEDQAAERYCYSKPWFQKQREKNEGPPYIKISSSPTGKILYPVKETDEWFKSKMITSGE